MRPNRWARRGSAAGIAALLLAGACSPKAAVMVTAIDAPSARPMRDFDLGTTSTSPPTTAPATTVLAHVAPPRASRSTMRPRPTPPAAPVTVAARSGECGGWRDLIAGYSWPVEQACRVMWCESRGDPNSRNRHSTATGLFQILGGPTDPAANVAQAFAMWRARGWQPWVCK